MNKLTIRIENYNLSNKEFIKYLLDLKGINNVINDNLTDEYITIEYNEDITLDIIVKEILLYLKINMPSISYFNKYIKESLEEYIITIGDLCCEYCLNSGIEQLLYMDGISEVYSNFDGINKNDVLIYVYYDKDKILEEDLTKMIYKFRK